MFSSHTHTKKQKIRNKQAKGEKHIPSSPQTPNTSTFVTLHKSHFSTDSKNKNKQKNPFCSRCQSLGPTLFPAWVWNGAYRFLRDTKQPLRWICPGLRLHLGFQNSNSLSADPAVGDPTISRGSQATRAIKCEDHKSDSQRVCNCNTLSLLDFATILPLGRELKGIQTAFAYSI